MLNSKEKIVLAVFDNGPVEDNAALRTIRAAISGLVPGEGKEIILALEKQGYLKSKVVDTVVKATKEVDEYTRREVFWQQI